MSSESDELHSISGTFIADHFAWVAVAAQIAPLAVQLAIQAGEEVQRPLTEAQLSRALAIVRQEADLLQKLQYEHWAELYKEGRLPPQARAMSVSQAAAENQMQLEKEEERRKRLEQLSSWRG